MKHKIFRTFLTLILLLCFYSIGRATTITIQSQAVPNWVYSTAAPVLRLFLDKSFVTSDGVPLQANSIDSKFFYKTVTCTISGTTVTIPSFTIDSTTDGRDIQTARYQAYFFTSSGAKIVGYQNFDSGFRVPATIVSVSACTPVGTCATWEDIRSYNFVLVPNNPPEAYTKDEVNRIVNNRITSAVIINGQNGGTQTIAIGATGSQPNVSSSGNVHTVNIPIASASVGGYLSSSDFNTFNAKQNALAIGNFTVGSNLSVTGGTSAVLGSGVSLSLGANVTIQGNSVTGSDQLVKSTQPTIDTPFISNFTNAIHNHQNAAGGSQLSESAFSFTDVITLNATASRHGLLPKLSGSSSDVLRGDGTWGAGGGGGGGGTWGSITGTLSSQTDLQTVLDTKLVKSSNLSDLTNAGTARTNLGLGTLATQNGTYSGTSSGTNTGDQTITLTNDVTGSGTGSFAVTIGAGKVTNAMLAGSIAYSKLSLTGAILNADLAGSIAYNKLTLTGSIIDADVNASAAIVWTKISKTGSSIADLTTRSASDLSSGTLPDARFPATLPVASGVNLTALNASNLTSGTVPLVRLSGITNTEISASAAIVYSKLNLTGAILNADLAGSIAYGKLSLTGAILNADLAGSIADTKLSTITTAGKVSDSALSSNIPLKNGANIFTAFQSITPAVNTSALVVSSYSLTGSDTHTLIDLSGTWNTSGNPTLIKANVTNTASNVSSLLLDLQVGGASKFNVDRTGNLIAASLIQGTSVAANVGGSGFTLGVTGTEGTLTTTGTADKIGAFIGASDVFGVNNSDFHIGQVPGDGFIDYNDSNSLLRIGVGGRKIVLGDMDAQGNNTQLRVDDSVGIVSINSITVLSDNPSFAVDGSAVLQVDSTVSGFLPPRMTTTQRDAIGTPAEGLIVHDITLHTANSYNGSAWLTIATTANKLSAFASTTSAELATTISNETGAASGSPLLVFNQSPVIATPSLTTGFTIGGTAASGTIPRGNGTNFIASAFTMAVPGTSGNVLTSDGTNWLSSAPSGGAPAGSDTYVQFKDSTVFGGDAQFTFNKTSGLITLTGASADGSALASFLAGSGASFVRINNNGTMVIDADSGTGSKPLQVKFAGTEIFSMGTTAAAFTNGASFAGGVFSIGNTGQVDVVSDTKPVRFGLSSQTQAIGYNATGVLEISNGTAGTFRDLKLRTLISDSTVRLKGYTVATLPAGTAGDTAYVTDALAPTFLATIVGGGSVVTPVFYNGTNWVGY